MRQRIMERTLCRIIGHRWVWKVRPVSSEARQACKFCDRSLYQPKAKASIVRGTAWLDHNFPDWDNRIN